MSQTSPVTQDTTFAYTEADAARIIGTDYGNSSFLTLPTGDNLARNLEKERKRLIGLELHTITLTEYYKSKKIPRGLRVSLRPTIFQDNAEFAQRYEQIINKCSFDILLLNIEYLQASIPETRTRVTELEKKLRETLQPSELKNLLTRTEDSIQRHRKEIEDKKRSKYQRDSEDYRQGRVYQWSGRSGDTRREFPREYPGAYVRNASRQRPREWQRDWTDRQQQPRGHDRTDYENTRDTAAYDSSASTSSSFLGELPPNTARKREEESRDAANGQRSKERQPHFQTSGQRRQPYRSAKRDNHRRR
ncbi:hypothetical protein XELAEV_18043634mg [Xenopus laevis]|nr:hypothetical protein XELAEV_18043634mg [Xenopus laevis]